MKRKGYLYDKIFDMDNLILADKNARKGKSKQIGVINFDKDKEGNLKELQNSLINREFKTSKYKIFKLQEGNRGGGGKERLIFQLPYYPDRILHHAVVNIIGDILTKSFTNDTYSCIKGRGIHKCLGNLTRALKDKNNTKYCLKLDIKKYYPSVNNEILKSLLRRKFKDKDLLNLLDEIIDSNLGLPIGNMLSQGFGNFYLTYFDHYLKEALKIENSFRYCDDIIILGKDKQELSIIKDKIVVYLNSLKLELSNWQIFPVKSRGIDYLGYVSYHDCIYLRKSIKRRFINMIKYNNNTKSIASYNGWLLACNSINLQTKYLKYENNKN